MSVGATVGVCVAVVFVFFGAVGLFIVYRRRNKRFNEEDEESRADRNDTNRVYQNDGDLDPAVNSSAFMVYLKDYKESLDGSQALADRPPHFNEQQAVLRETTEYYQQKATSLTPPGCVPQSTTEWPRHPAYNPQIASKRDGSSNNNSNTFEIAPPAVVPNANDGVTKASIPRRRPTPLLLSDDPEPRGRASPEAAIAYPINTMPPLTTATTAAAATTVCTAPRPRAHFPSHSSPDALSSLAVRSAARMRGRPARYSPAGVLPPGSFEAAAAISSSPPDASYEQSASTKRSSRRVGRRASDFLGLFTGGTRAGGTTAERGFQEMPLRSGSSDLYG